MAAIMRSRLGEGGGEGFLDKDVQARRSDPLDIGGMVGGGGAEDGEIGLRPGQAGVHIGEDAVGRDGEGRDGAGHACRVCVADARDLGPGMVVHLAQQVAHVEVVEVDADDAQHGLSFGSRQRGAKGREFFIRHGDKMPVLREGPG